MNLNHSKVTPEFMNWLAGFIAGEGCFTASIRNGRVVCRFAIELRNDDAMVLVKIRDTLNIGRINQKATRRVTVYVVEDIRGCLDLATLLQSYPLRAKKQACFDVWQTLVIMKAMGITTGLTDLVNELKQGKIHDEDKERVCDQR